MKLAGHDYRAVSCLTANASDTQRVHRPQAAVEGVPRDLQVEHFLWRASHACRLIPAVAPRQARRCRWRFMKAKKFEQQFDDDVDITNVRQE
jgi:hypothetical protein